MSNHILSPAEQERLALLIEECGEVIQAATKIMRHGWYSTNPLVENGPTNKDNLEKELGHLELAIFLVTNNDVLDESVIARARSKKEREMHRWLHFQ